MGGRAPGAPPLDLPMDLLTFSLMPNVICLTSLTRAKPKEKMEFPA